MIRRHLHIDPSGLPVFYWLLEKGVVLSANTGCTLRNFLCSQLDLSDEYLDQRVQTLCLDARPVDDVDTASFSTLSGHRVRLSISRER